MPTKKEKQPLSVTHPELAKEADGWDPSSITPGSGKKLKWKCQKGHSWMSVVVNRSLRNSTCPICSGRQILTGFNDLETKFPKVAAQAYGWDPSKFSPGSNKKMSWKCSVEHTWEEKIINRTNKSYGCPICSGQKTLPGFNDFKSLFPEIAKQAYGWDPSEVAPYSNLKKSWRCAEGHIWDSNVANRTRRGDGCSICSSHKTQTGYNDLATTDPLIAAQANGWDPKTLTRSSNKIVGWKCSLGHIWNTAPGTRVAGIGCPVCSGRKVLKGFNDLQTVNPKIAGQADGWDPRTVTKSSNKKLSWICDLGHRWESSVGNRTKGNGCGVCANQKVLKGFNDLATTNPELAKQAFGWDPSSVTSGSTKTRTNQWKCGLGHIWKATVALRSSGSGCPVCAGQRVWAGFNDLATTNPDLAKQAYEWDPTTLMAGSDKVRAWKCELGHIWNVRVADRKAGNNCPICSGQRVLSGFNDLATTHPFIAQEAHNWNPKTITAGSGLKRKFKCPEGHVYESVVGHRTSNKATGCPSCSQTGFSPNLDGFLYFLKQESWEMYQIGITNVPDDRLNRHKKLGWELLELRGPMDGYLTQQWETAILRMLKTKGADLSNSKIAGKFDGYSEAWSKSTFEVNSIKELMQLTEEFEENV